jgi:hypothetical protein
VLFDGRIAYAIRKPWGKDTHRVMQPVQFLARLAALIPPLRHPLIRFYGVFAPHSFWRNKVVPARSRCCEDNEGCRADPATAYATATASSLPSGSQPAVMVIVDVVRIGLDVVDVRRAALAPEDEAWAARALEL